MRTASIISALCLSATLATAQRPTIQYHIDATNFTVYGMSITERNDYLLLNEGGHLKLHSLDWVLDPARPLGTSLVSYWLTSWWLTTNPLLTDACDTQDGPEYVWAPRTYDGIVFRLVRRSTTYGGAYLEPRALSFGAPSGAQLTALLPLRGNTSNRSYNRLAAVGFSNGELRLLSVREPSNPANPPVVQQEAAVTAAHPGGVTALTYDPSTRRLVSGGVDGIIRVWQISGNLGSLTLTPVAQVANGWGTVQSLNFATNSSNQRLLLAASEVRLVSARSWNNGNPSATPLWTTHIDTSFVGDYSFFDGAGYIILSNPEPRSGLAAVQVLSSFFDGYSGSSGTMFLLNPDTGEVVYIYSSPLFPLYAENASANDHFFRAPSGVSYAVDRGGYLIPLNLSRRLTVGSHTQAATAVREQWDLVAVGYADGLVRVYQRVGNAWNLAASNNTEHANARIVALFWGSGQVLISIDSAGRVRAWSPTLGAPIARLDLYEIAGADIFGDLIAVIGQQAGTNAGAPQASLIRWNGTSFALDTSFTPAGQAPSKSISFAPGGTLVTLTNTAYARYSSTGTPQWAYSADPANLLTVATSRRIYNGWNTGLGAFRLDTGGGLLYWGSRTATRALLASDTSNPDQDELVWGAGFALPGGAYYHQLRRGVFTDFNGCTNFNTAWGAALPDEPLAIARDSSNRDGFYVACADGTVVYVTLPAPPTKPLAYGLLGDPSDLQAGQIATYLVELGQTWGIVAGGCPTPLHRVARLNPSTGAPTNLSAPRREEGYVPVIYLSPSGDTIWSKVGATLAAWTGSNPITAAALHQFGRNEYFRAFVTLSDTQVATLQAYQTTIRDNNGQYLWGWRLVWRDRTTQNGGLGVELASTPLVDNAGVPLHSRWASHDIEPLAHPIAASADRLCVAIMGLRFYPTSLPKIISIWRRTGTTEWDWALQRVLEAGQDYAGATPVSITFHPRFSDLLYVGMSNGELWLYNLSTYTPNPSNPRTATGVTIYTPTLGNPGSVTALDTGELVASNGYRYTVLAFGGGSGISVWATSPCNPAVLHEIDFYNIDAQFDWIRLQQQQGVPAIDLIYGTQVTLTRALIPEPRGLGCPGDVNNDRIVDDADLLRVLFRFGEVNCFCPEDVNCDGVIDDADLLIVLFNFGNQC